MEVQPDEVFHQGRKALLTEASKFGLDTTNIEQECTSYGDDPSTMTNSRLFARFMSKFRFYNPRAGIATITNEDDNGRSSSPPVPSLDAAWAYYEHVTLARYYVDDPNEKTMVRAEAGDKKRKSELYPIWKTPVKELGDFGISVRMYFSTLLVLAAFLCAAGFFNIPMMIYFWRYGDGNKEDIDKVIRGSAICDQAEWVVCESCNDEYKDKFPENRLDGENVLKNSCNFSDWLVPGSISFAASVALVFMFGIAFFWLQRRAEIVFDEEMQTASDYSVKIKNPPEDAHDPNEWKEFFTPFAQKGVTACTIALDNAELNKTLIARKRLIKKLQKKLPHHTDMKDMKSIGDAVSNSASSNSCNVPLFPNAAKLYEKLLCMDEKIRKLMKCNYKVKTVFVTFETERGQRNCLHALSTGKLNIWQNRVHSDKFDGYRLRVEEADQSASLDNLTDLVDLGTSRRSFHLPKSTDASVESFLLFRGQHVLDIQEAGEPNDVRWNDLQVPAKIRLFQRSFATILLFVGIAISGKFVWWLDEKYPGQYYTPLFITVTNIVVPKICEFINVLESHSTEGGRQASLYIKIAAFRWFNSAIVTTIVTGFMNTISNDAYQKETSLMYQIYPIIFAEIATIPLIKLLDIMGNIRKHLLAPRAHDQEEMNACFIGGKFELAERYTDATKVLFVALFYSAVLPESLFLGAAALLIHFVSGKFCLLRLWRPSPDVGSHLAKLSRNYFFSISLIVHVIMGGYWWSGYPYDNVCQGNDGDYDYCNQDMLRSGIFPPLPQFQGDNQQWMSDSQAKLVSIYGWSSVVIVGVGIIVFIKENIMPAIDGLFNSTYEPDGKDQGIDFSSVKHLHEVAAYVPQFREVGFAHPLIACDLQHLDEDLIGWKDFQYGFDRHNLFNDACTILGHDMEVTRESRCFSSVHHWPSPGTD